MIPSRAHFLLKRRIALSKDSFSPTLTVDIDIHLLLVTSDINYTHPAVFVKEKRQQKPRKSVIVLICLCRVITRSYGTATVLNPFFR